MTRLRQHPAILARSILIIAIALTYSPVLFADFGGWDDAMNLTNNPDFQPPSLKNISRYWFHSAFDLYAPATFTTWGAISTIAYRDDHLAPLPFHVANLLLHMLAALTAFEILLQLNISIWPACIGGIVFALQPLQVESVAWVSGLKDVLAGMLSLLAIFFYLKNASTRKPILYFLATIAFALAMLAKSSAVVVPAIAFILDFFLAHRRFRDSLVFLLPWFFLTIPIILIGRHAQPAAFIGPAVPFLSRPLVALDAIAFYLWKLIWPATLGIDYGRTPQIVIVHGWQALTWFVPLLIIAIILWNRRIKWFALAFAIFILALAPVLGFLPFDFQAYSTVADHYVYLAMLGPAIGIAFAIKSHHQIWPWIVCVIFASLSFAQTLTWKNAETISQQAILANSNSWASHENLARYFVETGHPDEAIPHAQTAGQMNPQFAKAFDTLGQAHAMLREFDLAEKAFHRAIEISPTDIVARAALANMLVDEGKFEQALEQYRIALQIEPNNPANISNLASVYAEMGQFDRAIALYDQALSINPNFPAAKIGRQHVVDAMHR